MIRYDVRAIVQRDGTVVLLSTPFHPGDEVEVTVKRVEEEVARAPREAAPSRPRTKYPYQDPFEIPMAFPDWQSW